MSKLKSVGDSGVLLDLSSVAELLRCSRRHVLRLAETGRMPAPIRVGRLLRWRRTEVLNWIDRGCPTGNDDREIQQ